MSGFSPDEHRRERRQEQDSGRPFTAEEVGDLLGTPSPAPQVPARLRDDLEYLLAHYRDEVLGTPARSHWRLPQLRAACDRLAAATRPEDAEVHPVVASQPDPDGGQRLEALARAVLGISVPVNAHEGAAARDRWERQVKGLLAQVFNLGRAVQAEKDGED
jgi:hypothetical protein